MNNMNNYVVRTKFVPLLKFCFSEYSTKEIFNYAVLTRAEFFILNEFSKFWIRKFLSKYILFQHIKRQFSSEKHWSNEVFRIPEFRLLIIRKIKIRWHFLSPVHLHEIYRANINWTKVWFIIRGCAIKHENNEIKIR